jgi:hypothetical protein
MLLVVFTFDCAYSQIQMNDYKVKIGKIVRKTLGADIEEFTQIPVKGKDVVILQREGMDIARIHMLKGSGRFHKFYYLLVVNNNNLILTIEMVDYPSEYGIGATAGKWLSGFSGKSPGTLEYGRNIDAVTGSTITAKSIVYGINNSATK